MILAPFRRRLTGLLAASLLIALAACSANQEPEPEAAPEPAAGFPVTIANKFGSTVIESKPVKVVTIGFNEQDFALAFGVEPVGVREFLGYDAPNRPWAPEGVRGKEIPTVGAEDLDLEKVVSLQPDLILGVNSYIDDEMYQQLDKIAPTLAQTDEYGDGATPWDEQTRLIGQALGMDAEAEAMVTKINAVFEQARADHPEFAEKRAAFLLGSSASGTWNVGLDDYRGGWLRDLGFQVDDVSGEVSYEKIDTVDRDVLVAEGVAADDLKREVFAQLPVVKEGRLVDLGAFDQDFAAALGFNSPLSIPFMLEIAVPRLAAATDGDPATKPAPYAGN